MKKDFEYYNTSKEAVEDVLQALEESYFTENFYYFIYNNDAKKRELYMGAVYYLLDLFCQNVFRYVNSSFIFEEVKQEATED